jgi:hypothetical protein
MASTRKVLFSSDFSDFITAPLSLNGATDWQPDWLVDTIIARNGFNILGGVPKVGKSLLRSHLLVCAVAGYPAFSELEVRHPAKRALLLAGEEAAEIEETRLRRAARGMGMHDGELPIQIMPQRGFFFDDYPSYGNFTDWVVEQGFDFVCIDPLIRWHRANENISGELSPVLSNLRVLTSRGVTLLIIHHTGKPKEGQENWPLGYLLRGSSDLAAVYDHLMICKGLAAGGATRRKLLFETRYSETPADVKIELQTTESSFTWDVHRTTKQVVERWFRDFSGRNWYSANSVADAVHRRKEDVLSALKLLTDEGLTEQAEQGYRWAEPGVGQAS